jgi:hypothetical protein
MNRGMFDRLAALEIRKPPGPHRHTRAQIDAAVSVALVAHRAGACLIELPMERNRRAAVLSHRETGAQAAEGHAPGDRAACPQHPLR